MVQREVGERFAAAPGSSAYGVPSVLAQLDCEVKVLRRIGRGVFRPVPNVDSVLLGLVRRSGPRATTTVTTLVHDAFAHRRKALARSLALGERASTGHPRTGAGGARRDGPAGRCPRRAALARAVRRTRGGFGGHVAARAGPPGQVCGEAFVRLRALAPAKVNLSLFLGPTRADGRHELVTLFQSLSLADEVLLETGVEGDHVFCPGVDGATTSPPPRSPRCGLGAGTGRRCACRSASGSRSPAEWAAVRRMPPRRCGSPAP